MKNKVFWEEKAGRVQGCPRMGMIWLCSQKASLQQGTGCGWDSCDEMLKGCFCWQASLESYENLGWHLWSGRQGWWFPIWKMLWVCSNCWGITLLALPRRLEKGLQACNQFSTIKFKRSNADSLLAQYRGLAYNPFRSAVGVCSSSLCVLCTWRKPTTVSLWSPDRPSSSNITKVRAVPRFSAKVQHISF